MWTNQSCWNSPQPTINKSVEDTTPVRHSDNFKIIVVLDESGSMESIGKQMRDALNSLIREQQQIKDRPCNFTLVKFNQSVNRVICNKDLQEVSLLTEGSYRPEGTTALYDAIGDTIEWFRYERDVLMVVITDGAENASTRYRKNKVMDMLKEKEKFCNWSYVYLGCDLQTAAQGDDIGFKSSQFSSNCMVKQEGYESFINKDLNNAISNKRKKGISVQAQLNQKY